MVYGVQFRIWGKDEMEAVVTKTNTHEEMDRMVADLRAKKDEWIQVGIPERISILKECMEHTFRVSEPWVQAACQAKGLSMDASTAAEEWLGGPATTLRNFRVLIEVLKEIQKHGKPPIASDKVRALKDGQLIVDVFPRNGWDKLMYQGFSGEIFVEPGVAREELQATLAANYQEDAPKEGKVALILGAGNVASIGPMDLLYKLFVENKVCALKWNPVNDYLGPFVDQSLQPLLDRGFVRSAYGAAEVGEYLVHHEGIDEVHITGSDRVHDIIVWGKPGEEQDENKKNGTPKLNKEITSELGCVSPVIIVPGYWTQKELDFQAANVATMVTNNASFNCNAAKVLITWKNWPQRSAFLKRVEEILAEAPLRKAYYPGSDKKYGSFLEAHPEANKLVEGNEESIPWTTIFDVDFEKKDDIVFQQEAWCGLLAETAVPAQNEKEWLRKVVDFCNDDLWGTLSCTVLAHPKTAQVLGPAFEEALQNLRYGSVGVNHWAALSYAFVYTTWGAYPGHTLEDIQSGIGAVHNALMIEKPQKSIVRGPFTMFPKPPWFVTHKNAHNVARKLVAFEYKPSLWRLIGILFSALRG